MELNSSQTAKKNSRNNGSDPDTDPSRDRREIEELRTILKKTISESESVKTESQKLLKQHGALELTESILEKESTRIQNALKLELDCLNASRHRLWQSRHNFADTVEKAQTCRTFSFLLQKFEDILKWKTTSESSYVEKEQIIALRKQNGDIKQKINEIQNKIEGVTRENAIFLGKISKATLLEQETCDRLHEATENTLRKVDEVEEQVKAVESRIFERRRLMAAKAFEVKKAKENVISTVRSKNGKPQADMPSTGFISAKEFLEQTRGAFKKE